MAFRTRHGTNLRRACDGTLARCSSNPRERSASVVTRRPSQPRPLTQAIEPSTPRLGSGLGRLHDFPLWQRDRRSGLRDASRSALRSQPLSWCRPQVARVEPRGDRSCAPNARPARPAGSLVIGVCSGVPIPLGGARRDPGRSHRPGPTGRRGSLTRSHGAHFFASVSPTPAEVQANSDGPSRH